MEPIEEQPKTSVGTTVPPVQSPRGRRWDAWHAGLGAIAVGLAGTSLWLWSEVVDEKSDSRELVAASEQRAQRMLDEQRQSSTRTLGAARQEAAQLQAAAFATALQPMMLYRGQVPEITDRSIQAATENLARQGNYSFVAVVDAAGLVVGSSDLTIIGQNYGSALADGVSTVSGENQAVVSIGSNGTQAGHVVIRVRPGGA